MEFLIFQLIVLIFSVVLHEVSHGLMADRLGDPTARLAGRLTLNPLNHLDFFGSFLLPLLLFLTHSPIVLGWAKPVPYNPYLLTKDLKYGPLKVALIGPFMNLILAILFGFLIRFLLPVIPKTFLVFLSFIVFINLLLGVFNLIPIPPLDGSKILTIFLPQRYSLAFQKIGLEGIFLVVIFLLLFSQVIFKTISFLFRVITGFPVDFIFVYF